MQRKFRLRKSEIGVLIFLIVIIITAIITTQEIRKITNRNTYKNLQEASERVAQDIRRQLETEHGMLEARAELIAQHDDMHSQEVLMLLKSYNAELALSELRLLLPDDTLLLSDGRILETEEGCYFMDALESESDITLRTQDIVHEEIQAVYHYVPVVRDGETIAILCGMIDLSDLPELWQPHVYDGNVAFFVIHALTGDIIVDTWHDTLGNFYELGHREMAPGYDSDERLNMIREQRSGYTVFISKNVGEYMYMYVEPLGVNDLVVGLAATDSVVFATQNEIMSVLYRFGYVLAACFLMYFGWLTFETRLFVRSAQKQANTDMLTGLRNRNSYEKWLEEYNQHDLINACIYVDANGLHELNNTKGHAAGDEMLRFLAGKLVEEFDADKTYRIGGDEFLAFALEGRKAIIRTAIERIDAAMTEREYHAAIGFACRSGDERIQKLISRAEKAMYDEKREYYLKTGIRETGSRNVM